MGSSKHLRRVSGERIFVSLCVFVWGCRAIFPLRGRGLSGQSSGGFLSTSFGSHVHVQGDKEPRLYDPAVSVKAHCPFYDDKNGLFPPDAPRPRFIVTGGAGFIGSHLVKSLRNAGIYNSQIKVLDNLWRGRLDNLQYMNGSWAIDPIADVCAMDLRNEQDTMQYVRGADYIYHLADIVGGVAYVFGHQEAVFRDNVLINSHTLHAAKRNRIPNYIYVGTACSFPKGLQEGPGIHPLRENQTYPAEPESAYGWSKLMGEYEADLAMEPNVFNVGILRFHNVYGPYSDYSLQTSQAIPSLIRKALAYPKEPYIVWGSGNQYRDFVFVDDIVRGLLLVKDRGMNRGTIQLGSKKATTILDLATEIGDIAGKRIGQAIPISLDVGQPEGDRGRIAAGDRAEHILGWKATVPLRPGL